MSYCTPQDLLKAKAEDILVQLTDDAGTGEVDEDVVDEALSLADGEIDSYLGRQYPVPLSPVPAVVRDAAVVLALCRLYDRRQGPPPDLDKRQDRVISWLKDLAAGRATLGDGDPAGTPPSGAAEISSSERVFSRETLKGF
ncbi:MAG: DUF1320 domain-containing protein [Thermodesulfobacteriota bacterium]